MAKKSDRIGERRHKQGIESRQRILQVAFEIAAERGYDGTTLAEVTKRAGVPPSSVYWQFENKDELLAVVVEEYYREWLATQAAWLSERPPSVGVDNVDFIMDGLAFGVVHQPQFQRLGIMLSLEQRVVELAARKRFREIRAEVRAAMANWISEALPDSLGERRKQIAADLAIFFIALSDGLLVHARVDETVDVRGVIEFVKTGLRPLFEGSALNITPTP